MSKQISIQEYQFIQFKDETKKNFINPKAFYSIENFILKNIEVVQYLKITTKKGYGKVLQAQNYVGVIQTKDGTTIEILPKITNVNNSKKILIKMLRTLKKSPFKNFNMAHLKSEKSPLLEIFISMFLEEVEKLIQKGIKSDYLINEGNLKFLKGKLKVSKHIKENFIHKENFFVEYDEYINNRIENKIIKSTLKYLYKKSKYHNNKKRIREFLFVFDDIDTSIHIKNDFSKIKLGRQMKNYEQVLIWSKTFLLENSYSPHRGDDLVFALLFDMNMLFESYVGNYLKKKKENVKLQDKRHYLAYLENKGKFRLKPDIVIDDGEIIADTKWKILTINKSHNGISQTDMYQLYAYGTKYQKCKKLYLIYPKDELTETYTYEYLEQNKLSLQILFFDLEKDVFIPSLKGISQ